MDPVTHALVGGLTAKTLQTSKRRFWIMMFLGEAPDFDVIFHGLGPWAFWLQHRGISHSVVGVLAQAFFYAAILSKWDKGPFKERVVHYLIPLVLHVFCDYLTSYGVPIFSPFDFREFGANLMTAVTPIPLTVMLIGLIVMSRKKIDGWRATRWVWAGWGLTLIFAFSGKSRAEKFSQTTDGAVTVVAGMINPIGWTAVTQPVPCCEYRTQWVNSITGTKKKRLNLQTNLEEFPIKASLTSVKVEQAIKVIQWPVARSIPQEYGGWRVEWGKMIFSSRGVVRGLWAVNVSSTGTVGEAERIVYFWNPYEKN